jgi:protein TonB
MDLFFDQDRQGWTTLAQVQTLQRHRWSLSLVLSVIVHGTVLLVLCLPALPIFIKPSFIARGEGGTATPESTKLYLPADFQIAARVPPLLSLPVAVRNKAQKTKLQKRSNALDLEKAADSIEAGSTSGSSFDGPAAGDEVKPAIPSIFPDPRISRSELPSGVQGDVIVEITIDAQGNVVEERLLQGLGHGVDEKVIAVLRDWHFHPATRNGVAIASKHDVRYHFPS